MSVIFFIFFLQFIRVKTKNRKQQKVIIVPFELFHETMSKVRFNKKEDLDDVASYEELERTVYGEEEGNKKSRTNSRSVPRK